MAERSIASASSTAPVASDVGEFDSVGSMSFAAADKHSAVAAFACESVEEPNGKKRAIEDVDDDEVNGDDVVARPLVQKRKWIDEELPDVDDDEEFPQQTEERGDEELACGLTDERSDVVLAVVTDEGPSHMVSGSHGVEGDVGMSGESRKDVDKQTEVQEDGEGEKEEGEEDGEEDGEDEREGGKDEDVDGRESLVCQNHGIDIVDVDDDDGEEDGDGHEQFSEYDSEEEEDDEEEVEDDDDEAAEAVARARNQREARQLLQQLDGSTRSKLCLTVLEKYGEELLYGHEDARDAILVDACAHESALSLMRDAIRVRDLYARGSSAATPVELDDDDDIDEGENGVAGYAVASGDDDIEEEGDEEAGGYEDEEEDADDEDETIADEDDDDDDIVVISEEEVEDRVVCERDSESRLDESTHDRGCCGSENEEGDVGSVKMLRPVTVDASAEHDDERFNADYNQDKGDAGGKGAALHDTGAARKVAAPANTGVANVSSLQMPVADSAT